MLPVRLGTWNPEGRELITAAAIARMAGVGRAAVSNWRKRYPGFPKPAGGSPNSPTFDRAEVLTWLKETGKADQLATAGRTDGGTIRVGASGADTMDKSFGKTRHDVRGGEEAAAGAIHQRPAPP